MASNDSTFVIQADFNSSNQNYLNLLVVREKKNMKRHEFSVINLQKNGMPTEISLILEDLLQS